MPPDLGDTPLNPGEPRYDTDAIEKFMVLLFITEDSYRMAGVSQALGMDTQQAGTWVALDETDGDTISPTALWALVQWLGQLSPAQLNLALGVDPPTHVIEDEKHVQACWTISTRVGGG
jgi:hypothetical protein